MRDQLPAQSTRVAVAIATYKRPEELASLLKSLNNQATDCQLQIVVVDNDLLVSAREVVSTISPNASYVHEPRPGISAARNAGIEEALRFRPWAIAFIDDDETADEYWVQRLIESMIRYRADVVTGPVEYELDNAPADDKYFCKIERPTGTQVRYVATNNAMVRAAWLMGETNLRFDERFGLSGGEDLEMFLRLQKFGGTCVWVADALVTTRVPLERTRRPWLLRRELRNGQLIARLRQDFDDYSRCRLFAVGVQEICQGLTKAITGLLAGRRINMASQFKVMAGIGWIRTAVGYIYLEYARIDPAPDKRRSQTVGAPSLNRHLSVRVMDRE